MSSRDAKTHFEDILISIEKIERFMGDRDFDAYSYDEKTKSAEERQLQILTEAAFRLGNDAESQCPGIDWKGYRGFGNILRHAYHLIKDELVWKLTQQELPLMKVAALDVLRKLAESQGDNL